MGQQGMGITSRGNIWGSVMVRATQSMCAIVPGLLAPPRPRDAVQDMVAHERAAIERSGYLAMPHPAWRAVRGRFRLASTPAWRHREPVPGLLARVWNGH
jgi:hypothetical protein